MRYTWMLPCAVLGGVLYAAVLGRDSITFALDS